jgi:hypothetical protein
MLTIHLLVPKLMRGAIPPLPPVRLRGFIYCKLRVSRGRVTLLCLGRGAEILVPHSLHMTQNNVKYQNFSLGTVWTKVRSLRYSGGQAKFICSDISP